MNSLREHFERVHAATMTPMQALQAIQDNRRALEQEVARLTSELANEKAMRQVAEQARDVAQARVRELESDDSERAAASHRDYICGND